MTEKELSNYFYLKREAEDLEERLATLGYGVAAIQPKELNISSNKQKSSIQEKITQLKEIWIEKRVKALEEYIKIEKYIGSIEDIEIRTIMRYRYLDLKRWDEIGDLLHYDRTSPSKKMRTYLKNHNSHNSHSDLV